MVSSDCLALQPVQGGFNADWLIPSSLGGGGSRTVRID